MTAELTVDVVGTAVRPVVLVRSHVAGQTVIDATASCLYYGAICDVFELRRDGQRVPFTAQARRQAPQTGIDFFHPPWRPRPAPDTANVRWGLWRAEPRALVVRLDRWYALGTPGRYEVRYRARVVPGAPPLASNVVSFTVPGPPPPAASLPDVVAELAREFADPAVRIDSMAARLGRVRLPAFNPGEVSVLPDDPRFASARVTLDHESRRSPHPFTVELEPDEQAPLTLGDLVRRLGPYYNELVGPEAPGVSTAWYMPAGDGRDRVAVFATLRGYRTEPAARVREVMIRWDGP